MSASSNAAKDDYTLMASMAAGDASALAAFYDRYSPIVYATAARMLNDRTTADELLVDVFHEVWIRANQYDAARSNPLTYLLTLTRSRTIDRRRTMHKKSNLQVVNYDRLPESSDHHGDALSDAITQENAVKVREALGTLDPDQRRAIEAAYYDGLSHSEIADLLNKPLGTIKTYIRQGLIRLRGCLRNDDEAAHYREMRGSLQE